MTEELLTTEKQWTAAGKIFFLSIALYTFLYFFPFPFQGALPFYTKGLDAIVMWTGTHLLHLQSLTKIEETGSGDTTFDYVKLLVLPVIAILLALLILVIDRKRKNYVKLRYWYFVYARYNLGIYMIVYGIAKVFHSQFPFPALETLEKPYGESSPMGLLWTFMGYSPGYNIYTGAAEVLGGALLLFRRTTALGTLVIIGVMSNVLMLNLCYDVPVKLFSAHLIFFAMIILAPDAKAVYDFFIRHKREAVLVDYIFPFKSKWVKISRIVLKSIIILASLASIFIYALNEEPDLIESGKKPPLYGIYKTASFILNHDTLPPLTGDSIRWNRLIVENGYAQLRMMNDREFYYSINVDSVNKKIQLKSYQDSTASYNFKYTVSKDFLTLDGKWQSDSLQVKFKKVDLNKILLIKRGFHWINEYPFNR